MNERQQQQQTRTEYQERENRIRLDDIAVGEAEKAALRNMYPGVNERDLIAVYQWVEMRGLNPLQRWYHVVSYGKSTTIMPSIDLYRQIAHQSGVYAGCRRLETGARIDVKVAMLEWEDNRKVLVQKTVTGPEFIKMEFRKIVQGTLCSFETELRLTEAMPLKSNGDRPPLISSEKWLLQPERMLAKCVEALGLRMAFADLGGTHTDDEMDGIEPNEPAYVQRLNDAPRASVAAPPAPNLDALPAAAPAPAKAPPAPRPEPQQEDSARPAAIQPPAASLTDAERQRVKQLWSTRPKSGNRAELEVWVVTISRTDRDLMDRWASANRDNSDASVKTLANLWASLDIPF